MCAAVVLPVNPDQERSTVTVLLALSLTVAVPVPVRVAQGLATSLAALSAAPKLSKVWGLAWLSESVHGPVICGASWSVPAPVHDTVIAPPFRVMLSLGPPPPPNGP